MKLLQLKDRLILNSKINLLTLNKISMLLTHCLVWCNLLREPWIQTGRIGKHPIFLNNNLLTWWRAHRSLETMYQVTIRQFNLNLINTKTKMILLNNICNNLGIRPIMRTKLSMRMMKRRNEKLLVCSLETIVTQMGMM